MITKAKNGFEKIRIPDILDTVVENAIKEAVKAKKKNNLKLTSFVCITNY